MKVRMLEDPVFDWIGQVKRRAFSALLRSPALRGDDGPLHSGLYALWPAA